MANPKDAISDLLKDAISDLEEHILDEESKRSTTIATEKLHQIAARYGLGVAILAAWCHGLEVGHIVREGDLKKPDGSPEGPIDTIEPDPAGGCPYFFIHIPVRKYRGVNKQLEDLGIMNNKTDPTDRIYHEDGLVSILSFPRPRKVEKGPELSLSDDQIAEILDALSSGGYLLKANLNNRQIQFRNEAAKRKIRSTGGPVYVVNKMPDWDRVRLPSGLLNEEIREYVMGVLGKKRSCNYCSAQAQNPREVTVHTTPLPALAGFGDDEPPKHEVLRTVRNYQLGFTFAAVGKPEEICHFLAWDFPHINDVVMSMEPHAASFSDLVTLVQVINYDIRQFCRTDKHRPPEPGPIYGVCNHWAGNTIYHQHYQFFRLPYVPLLDGSYQWKLVADNREVEVFEVGPEWPSRAFKIKAKGCGQDAAVGKAADRMAREWRMLSEESDLTYGNGISIKNHTHNGFVAQEPDGLVAVFIPRHRRKLDASARVPRPDGSAKDLVKKNAGVLEMLGYFVIDNPDDFELIKDKKVINGEKRADLARSWLRELTPAKGTIAMFRKNIGICLKDGVSDYEAEIDKIYGNASEGSFDELRESAAKLALHIQGDKKLKAVWRGHLYRELLAAMLESGGMTG